MHTQSQSHTKHSGRSTAAAAAVASPQPPPEIQRTRINVSYVTLPPHTHTHTHVVPSRKAAARRHYKKGRTHNAQCRLRPQEMGVCVSRQETHTHKHTHTYNSTSRQSSDSRIQRHRTHLPQHQPHTQIHPASREEPHAVSICWHAISQLDFSIYGLQTI